MSDELLRKATEMRNAIDMIEGALMGLGDFVDLPDLFDGTPEHVAIAPKMTVGEMRRVCTALAECTRIVNAEEFAPDELRRHAQGAPNAADAMISQIEERFPNWKSYRDLVDCVDCTLHALRGTALTSTDGAAPAITMEQVVDWLNANTSSYTMQPRDRPHAQND